MSKFSLSTYLMISVLIILSGVLWILFFQMDKNYAYPAFSSELLQEQSDIISRVYQIRSEVEAPVIQQEVTAIEPTTAVPEKIQVTDLNQVINSQQVQQANQDLKPLPQTKQYNNLWSTFPNSEYESYYNLRNNPWSPDYKPGDFSSSTQASR